MSALKAIAFGLLGGVVGAAVWTGVTYATGYELGLIAWVIGLLTGIGVAIGAGGAGTVRTGLLSASVAVVAILLGKAGVVAVVVNQMVEEALAEGVDDESAVEHIAEETLAQWQAEGRSLEYPFEMSAEDAEMEGIWPVGVEEAAQRRWFAMTSDQQEQYRAALMAQREEEAMAARGIYLVFALIWSFGPWDLVWCGLAISTAYKVARTAQKTDNAEADIVAAPAPSFAAAPSHPAAPRAARLAPADPESATGSPLRGLKIEEPGSERLAPGVPAAWADRPLMAQDPNDVGREAA